MTRDCDCPDHNEDRQAFPRIHQQDHRQMEHDQGSNGRVARGGELMASKFGVSVHPTVNESNTHTDEELMSPEFRAGVELLKNMIRIVVVRSGIADKRLDNIATY
jgi:hypothetical protein